MCRPCVLFIKNLKIQISFYVIVLFISVLLSGALKVVRFN